MAAVASPRRPVAGSPHDGVHRLCHGLHLAWSDPVLGTSLRRTLMDQPRPAARPGRATRPRDPADTRGPIGDFLG